MPWTGPEFKRKHARDLTDAQADEAAKIANAILSKTGNEGMAISTGIKRSREQSGYVVVAALLRSVP